MRVALQRNLRADGSHARMSIESRADCHAMSGRAESKPTMWPFPHLRANVPPRVAMFDVAHRREWKNGNGPSMVAAAIVPSEPDNDFRLRLNVQREDSILYLGGGKPWAEYLGWQTRFTGHAFKLHEQLGEHLRTGPI
jgi:hypothetical protein